MKYFPHFQNWILAGIAGLIVLSFAGITAVAQPAPSAIRVVNGKIYDLRVSPQWLSVTGEVRRVLTNGVLIQLFHVQNVYGPGKSGNTLQKIGAYGGGQILLSPVIGTEKVYGKSILLQNLPTGTSTENGKTISSAAMWVGTERLGAGAIEIWDCGRPATDDEIQSSRAELEAQAKAFAEARAKQKQARDADVKAKVVAFQKEQAGKGLAPYQYELGLRYLKGDGVETNREEGIRWLKLAAGQGYEDAAKELGRLGEK